MRPMVALWIMLLVLGGHTCVAANTEIETVYLERGQRGIVPCPLITSQELTIEEVDAMYWYFRHQESRSLLISYFGRIVAPQNGIPEGVYDIDHKFSLVIENVTDSDEGNYVFAIKPEMRLAKYGRVPVAVKVSPREPFPIVHDEHSSDGTSTLTCIVHHAKPAMVVKWLRVLSDGYIEDIHADETVEHTLLPKGTTREDSFWINNTYTTSATIKATPVQDDDTRYRCEVYGDTLGDRNGRHVTVILIETRVSGEVGRQPGQSMPSTRPPITKGASSPFCDEEDATAASATPDHEPHTIMCGVLIGVSVFFVSSFLL